MHTPSSSPQRSLNPEEFSDTKHYLDNYLHPLVTRIFPHINLVPYVVDENDDFVYKAIFEIPISDEESESLAYRMTIEQICAILRGSSNIASQCLGKSHIEGFTLCRFEVDITIPRHEVSKG